MSRDSIVSRVTRGTALASLITAVALAAASAIITLWLWKAREQRDRKSTRLNSSHG